MNILPLVFSFLIIFSCLCFTFLKEVNSLTLIELTLEGYNHTEKAIKNALVKKAYHKIKEDLPLGSSNGATQKTGRLFHSKRVQFPPQETSKFYLRALAKSEMPLSEHPLYEPLSELLRCLSQKTVFDKYPDKKDIEYKLIEALVKKAQKFPSAKELSYLYPEDPELQKIYYKIVKGTNSYTQEAGIPPLAHFLSLENSDKAAFLSLASPLVLKAFFGTEGAEKILSTEKIHFETDQKYYFFSKEDLETLLMKEIGSSGVLSSIQPYLNYSKQNSKQKSIAKQDKLTGISIEKQLF